MMNLRLDMDDGERPFWYAINVETGETVPLGSATRRDGRARAERLLAAGVADRAILAARCRAVRRFAEPFGLGAAYDRPARITIA